MKRFYKNAAVTDSNGGGFGVALDGRPIKTPARNLLTLPTRQLAGAVADEWNRQGEKLDHLSMPLTQLANTALDRMPEQRDPVVAELTGFVETDLVFFWAEHPQNLVERQATHWQPIIDWASRRFDALFLKTSSLAVPVQPAGGIAAIGDCLASLDDLRLTAVHLAAGTVRSCLIALALAEREIDAETAFFAAMVDELHQLEQWGDDKEARARLDALRAELKVVDTMFRTLGSE